MSNNKKEQKTDEQLNKRLEKINQIIATKEAEGYVNKEYSVSLKKMTVVCNIVAILAVTIVFIVYFLEERTILFLDNYWGLLLFLVVSFLFIFAHEGLHALAYVCYTPNRFKNIEFGIIPSKGVAYCVCCEPLKKSAQIMSLITPGIILGVIPAIISIIVKDYVWLLISITQIVGAGADIWLLVKLLSIKTMSDDALFMENDAQNECTIYVLDKCQH